MAADWLTAKLVHVGVWALPFRFQVFIWPFCFFFLAFRVGSGSGQGQVRVRSGPVPGSTVYSPQSTVYRCTPFSRLIFSAMNIASLLTIHLYTTEYGPVLLLLAPPFYLSTTLNLRYRIQSSIHSSITRDLPLPRQRLSHQLVTPSILGTVSPVSYNLRHPLPPPSSPT